MDTSLFKNQEFARALDTEFIELSGLAYDIEKVNPGNGDQYELSICSTSLSEIEGSEEGVLGTYVYWSKKDAQADIELAEKLTNINFDEI